MFEDMGLRNTRQRRLIAERLESLAADSQDFSTDCRRIVEVRVCLPPELLQSVERSTGFRLEGHEVELFGRCAECRARAEEHD